MQMAWRLPPCGHPLRQVACSKLGPGRKFQGSAGALSHYLHLLLPSLQSLRTGCDQVFPSRVGTLLAFCCRVLSALQVVRGSALVSLF